MDHLIQGGDAFMDEGIAQGIALPVVIQGDNADMILLGRENEFHLIYLPGQ